MDVPSHLNLHIDQRIELMRVFTQLRAISRDCVGLETDCFMFYSWSKSFLEHEIFGEYFCLTLSLY